MKETSTWHEDHAGSRLACVAALAARRWPPAAGATSRTTDSARERQGLRRPQHRGQPVGRLRGQRPRHRVRRRDQARLQGRTTRTSRRRSPGRASATGDVDAIVENWGHPDLKKKYIDEQKTAVDAGPTGQRRHHRLVRPAVDGREVPRHHRLEEPEQVRRPVQDLGVGRQGPAARRRPVATSPTTRRWSRTSTSTTRWSSPAARPR